MTIGPERSCHRPQQVGAYLVAHRPQQQRKCGRNLYTRMSRPPSAYSPSEGVLAP
jgi:hypothetical protein